MLWIGNVKAWKVDVTLDDGEVAVKKWHYENLFNGFRPSRKFLHGSYASYENFFETEAEADAFIDEIEGAKKGTNAFKAIALIVGKLEAKIKEENEAW